MRDVDPAITAALGAGALKERKFYTLTAPLFSNGVMQTEAFWNDLGPLTEQVLDGLSGAPVYRNFKGSGTLITCGQVLRSSDLNPRNITVTLNQTDNRIDSLVRGYNLKNAYCELHSGLFNPLTHVLVAPAECLFSGYVDGCTIQSPAAGQAGSVSLKLVSNTREATRAGYQVRSHADQQQRNPADNFLKYTAILSGIQIYWYTQRLPVAAANPSVTASPSNPFGPLR